MLGAIESTTKWAAAQDAVSTVLTAYPEEAQYGLMLFPGAAGQCTTGEVKVEIAAGTANTIVGELSNLVIPNNNQTPAGQTLMAASKYPLITDPNYNNYVIFVTDGYQYCSLAGGTACVTPEDCTEMGDPTCDCKPDMNDGCYCVQEWPVLGAQALTNAGVNTYVVGFGSSVNTKALNQAADVGGTALPNCDPNSDMPSCYFQATVPAELTAAFSQIVQQVVTETCTGPCGIMGERTCTLNGWTDCDAPDTISCKSTCDTDGTQTCVDGSLTECSSEPECGSGGSGGTVSTSASSGSAGASAAGGSSGSAGAGGAQSGGAPPTDGIKDDDPEQEGSCACRTAVGSHPKDSSGPLWLLAMGTILAASRRRS